ncbi:MAG: alanine--tRNA ligase, partial [Pseudomonadota bacterium]
SEEDGDRFVEIAWTLLTKEFGLPAEKLLVTVYHTDDEAYDLWKRIAGLPDEKIIRIATSDNFWSAGDTGPCGPCSEIFYDHGDHIWGGPPGSSEEDGDRFVEIWNLVFMQFEQVDADTRIDLPKPSIDTGMGLERIAAVLQGTHDNYEIDLFRALISASEEAVGHAVTDETRASHRVIADHLRASCFLIGDGVLPSNEGRGYVLRRIMRRAMRHASLLGAETPLMHRLVPALVSQMGQAYPELGRAQSLMTETLKLEETRFRKTLKRGLSLLDDATAGMSAGDELDGGVAFKLYDTYGFPLDLTQDALRRREITVNTTAYNEAMERQKAEARASWTGAGGAADETIWFNLREEHGSTEFFGYETEQSEGALVAIVRDGEITESAASGEEVVLVFNQTPFYAESGGQMGDAGTATFPNGVVDITDTKKRGNGVFAHYGTVSSGTLSTGDAAVLEVDHDRRRRLRSNHSATHLVHEALRQVLGDHVAQKGSLVAPERLRFDFSHNAAVDTDALAQVDEMANAYVLQNSPVSTTLMAVDDAIAAGAQAQFGEKYGDEVRVVSMGETIEGEDAGKPWSLELCGGTHVKATGDIGLIALVGESAVSSGVRRIEALTGDAARAHLQERDGLLRSAADTLKSTPADVPARVAALVAERKQLENEVATLRRQIATGAAAQQQDDETVAGVRLAVRVLEGVPAKDLKSIADENKQRIGSGVVVIISKAEDGKAAVVTGVTADLTSRFDAVALVREASMALGGKGGGGRPDLAQAGGPDGDKAGAAVEAVKAALA